MIWGKNKEGIRIKAEPKGKATCPVCDSPLIPKCGKIVMWHWAHKSSEDCDSWSDGETQWHLKWKNEFPAKNQEVVIGKHRADIMTDSGRIIELQNSNISSEEIYEREYFYEKMIWLLNGEKFAKNLILRPKGDYFSFRWKWPPKTWWNSSRDIFIDLNPLLDSIDKKIKYFEEKLENDPYISDEWCLEMLRFYSIKRKQYENSIFLIKKVYDTVPCGGWGIIISKEDFLKQYGN